MATSKKTNVAKKHARESEEAELQKKAASGDSYAAEKLARMQKRDKEKSRK